MKHTPGPWRIVGTKIIADDGSTVIDCIGAMGGTGETRADKQLLAAAPEMLETIKRLLEQVAETGTVNQHEGERAKALIAKIES